MGGIKGKCKKNMIFKKWQSFGDGGGNSNMRSLILNKGSSKSFSEKVPKGCFSVYVGSERQRFIVKTKFVAHPLFKMLLDEAEVEFGFQNDGPIRLPCKVDLFYKVLAEMNNFGIDDKINDGVCRRFNNAKRFSLFCSSKPKLYE